MSQPSLIWQPSIPKLLHNNPRPRFTFKPASQEPLTPAHKTPVQKKTPFNSSQRETSIFDVFSCNKECRSSEAIITVANIVKICFFSASYIFPRRNMYRLNQLECISRHDLPASFRQCCIL